MKDLGAQIQAGYKFSEDITAFFGYEFVNYDVSYLLSFGTVDEPENLDFQGYLFGHNIYSEGQFQIDDLFVRSGARISGYPAADRLFFEPRLYADYTISDAFKLKASAEIKNQAISQVVLFDFNQLGFGNTLWVSFDQEEGTPILNNKQFTFGFFLNENGWKLDVEGYYKRITGLTSLTRGFQSATAEEEYYEGNSTVRGIDVLIKKKINTFRTWLSYSYSQNDFEFPDLQNGTFPGNFDQRHVFSWSGSYKYKAYQFSLGWQFATGRPFTNAFLNQDNEITFGQQNANRLGDYHKLDLSAFYDFHLDAENSVRGRLGVSVINIYNRDNEIDRAFREDENAAGNAELQELSNVGLGITPNLVFRVYF